jgi:hypothetical protein
MALGAALQLAESGNKSNEIILCSLNQCFWNNIQFTQIHSMCVVLVPKQRKASCAVCFQLTEMLNRPK